MSIKGYAYNSVTIFAWSCLMLTVLCPEVPTSMLLLNMGLVAGTGMHELSM